MALLRLLRRYLTLLALMVWQGGFFFYTAIVVPIGQATLDPPQLQGFITRQVTDWINTITAAALVVLALELAFARDRWWRTWLRWASWLVMAGTLVLLLRLHGDIDQYLDVEGRVVLDRVLFRRGHRWYLWASTVQWGVAMLYVLLMLFAWRWEDSRPTTRPADTR